VPWAKEAGIVRGSALVTSILYAIRFACRGDFADGAAIPSGDGELPGREPERNVAQFRGVLLRSERS